jgi:hypothetical protein
MREEGGRRRTLRGLQPVDGWLRGSKQAFERDSETGRRLRRRASK